MKKKALSWLLVLTLILGLLPTALAAEGEVLDGEMPVVCTKDENCEAETHDEDCPLYVAPKEPAEEVEEFIPADSAVTALQERIDALTGADALAEMDAEEQAEVYAEVCAIYDAIDELADEEATELDTTALEEAAAFFTRQIMPLDEGDNDTAMSGSCGAEGSEDSVTWNLEQNNQDSENPTYTLTISGSGAMADFKNNNGTLSYPWLNFVSQITSVVIAEDITTVGQFAFRNFENLENVTFEENSKLTKISNAAFAGCTKLASITIPEGLTSFSSGYEFNGCSNLLNVILLGNVTQIGTATFAGTKISSIDLSTVKTIGERAFSGCKDLAEISEFSEGVTIGDRAFENTNLTTINLEGVSTVGYGAFCNVPFSGTLTVPASITSISHTNDTNFPTFGYKNKADSNLENVIWASDAEIGGFRNCANLKTVSVSGNPTKIAARAFYGCTNLKSCDVPDSVTAINVGAFENCGSLKYIRLPTGLTTITGDNNAFKGAGLCLIDATAVTATTATSSALSGFDSSVSLVQICVDNLEVLNTLNFHSRVSINKTVFLYTNGGIPVAEVPSNNSFAEIKKEGYSFGGWYQSSDCSGESSSTPVPYSGNVGSGTKATTYYAKWVSEITFDGNGATSGSMTAQEIAESDTATTLTANGFTKTGYTFSGWNTAADGSGTSYADQATGVGANGSTTLYAQWTPNTYTISFNGGTGASGSTASVTATYDQPAPLTANGFTNSGYNFAGWSQTENGTTVDFSDGAQVENLTESANGTVTLYAVWTTKTVLAPDVTAQTKTYNGTEQSFTLDGSYTITYQQDGLTATPKDAGTYDVVISSEETESTAAYKNTVYGGLVINPAPLTITADNQTIYVGSTLPEYTYTVSGLVGEDKLTDEPTVACAGADANTAGTYTITASGASAGDNYTITYVNGTLTVRTKSSGGGGGGTTTYAVTVDSARNGSVSVSPKTASKGTTVTITVKPDSGYELDDLTVTDKNGDAVKLTRKSDTQYTFTMPASKVTVEASFTVIEEQPAVSFVDVSTSAYYYDAVAWAVENGVTSGTSATTFSPDAACTRAQAVTFLWRAAGSPAPKSSVNPFADVPTTAYYYDAVLWAVGQGITAGTSATTFSPDATCTRGQIVTFLYRADGTATTSSNPFTDVADSTYYANAVKWAVAEGVTSGTSATTFSPDASCTRGQIVTFLYRAYAD